MYRVCAHYCGTTIMLAEFDTMEKANEFMNNDCVIVYEDEFCDNNGDDVIYKDEMFIEDCSSIIPFCDPPTVWDESINLLDDLPF